MNDLFAPITRTERQKMCEKAWIAAKGIGTVVGTTGFGKTRIGTDILQAFIKKKSDLTAIVVVPTQNLQDQWIGILENLGINKNVCVLVINTAAKQNINCDLLIIDEIHRSAAETLIDVFNSIKYKYILGLTATFERLDERHELIKKYCPIVDTVTDIEALANGWVSLYKEYQILIDVDDIQTLKDLNTEFNSHFEFFNWDFNLAMSMCGPKGYLKQIEYRNTLCPNGTSQEKSSILTSIKMHSAQLMRIMQARKKFINNHPKKIEIARKIIQARPDAKIITFSNNVAMAEQIGMGGKVFSGKDTKKKSRVTVEEFKNGDFKILHTIQKANEGMDIPGLSVAIMLGIDSAKIKAQQRKGRVIRKEDGKQAEIFNIIINNSAETKWFENSHSGSEYTTIDEEGLNDVLCGKEPKPYKKKIKDFTFRF